MKTSRSDSITPKCLKDYLRLLDLEGSRAGTGSERGLRLSTGRARALPNLASGSEITCPLHKISVNGVF